jgi:hypothetical protein
MPIPLESRCDNAKIWVAFLESLAADSPDHQLRQELRRIAMILPGLEIPFTPQFAPEFSSPEGYRGLAQLANGLPRDIADVSVSRYLQYQIRTCKRILKQVSGLRTKTRSTKIQ